MCQKTKPLGIAVSVASVLVLCLWLISSKTQAAAFSNELNGHWAEALMLEAVTRGIIVGYPNGTYQPDRVVTRAEFCALVARAVFPQRDPYPQGRITPRFRDLDINHWGSGFIEALAEKGILVGDDSHLVRPDSSISRSEAAVVIERTLRGQGIEPDLVGVRFNDWESIPEWARDSVYLLSALQISVGDDRGNFRPAGRLTRAEGVALVLRLLEATGSRSDLEGKIDFIDLSGGRLWIEVDGDIRQFRFDQSSVVVVQDTKLENVATLSKGRKIGAIIRGGWVRLITLLPEF